VSVIDGIAWGDGTTSSVDMFPPSWKLLSDVELMQMPDPQWSIDRILPDEGVAVVYGPSGACKTTLITAILGAIATGGAFYGHAVTLGGTCIYVAAEDPPGFKVRVGAWKRAHRLPMDKPIGIYTFPEAINLRDVADVARFERFVLEQAAPVRGLVIDTYAASTPGANENSSEDTTVALTHARRWQAALRCLVIVVHHTNAGGSRERGHSGLRAGVDTMISLTPEDDRIIVECSKQRNAAPFEPMVLKLVPVPGGDGCVLRPAADVIPSSGLSTTQQKVLSVLRDTFATDGASKSEWQRACHDVPDRSFHRAAKSLGEKGLIRQVGAHWRPTGVAA